MTRRWIAVAGMAAMGALLALSATAQDKMSKMDKMHGGGSTLSAMDKTFMKKAAQGGMAEVKLGELAAKQGSSDQVKQFGQKMVDDHGKANDALKEVAAKKNFTLPGDIDAKSKATLAKLEKLHGAAFDAAYIKDMKMDHQADIAEFQKEVSKGKDPDVKGFASSTLPTVKEHYTMISGMSKSGSSKMSHGKM